MKVSLVIKGEPASKANTRKLATVGPKDKRRLLFIKSEKARNYERDALPQIPTTARLMLAGPVRVTMRIYYASERPDLDESVVLDVLQAKRAKGSKEFVRRGVYVNDRQVREKHVYHAIDRANPRTEIEVEEIAAGLFEELPAPPVRSASERRFAAIGAMVHGDPF